MLALAVGVLTILVAATGLAQAQATRTSGALTGEVRDVETKWPVGWVEVLLEEVSRFSSSRENGQFKLINIPPGTYTLKTFRIGYESLQRQIEVSSGDTTHAVLWISSSPIVAGDVVVEGERVGEASLGEPALSMEGTSLRQNLSGTIAQTLRDEPGIAMRSMGPAPARPVLRGLGSERLLVLEDGERTGDLSATSPDHAVVIEPLTAQRIEVVRGPPALVYGPNTIGGAVNVVRGYVPSVVPAKVGVTVTAQGETVNSGLSTGLAATMPVGRFALRADGTFRNAGDVQTPAGTLENTALETYNASVGGSYVAEHGFVGGAFAYYQSEYGIPGGFVGAHPNGVSIQMKRRHSELKGEFYPHASAVPRVEAKGTYSWYFLQEFESNGSLGVEFGVLSYHGKVVAYTASLGPFTKGAVGIWGEYRDYASGGFTFTPASKEGTVAGFVYQDLELDLFTLQAGLRYDFRTVRPDEQFESDIGLIRQRDFGGLSASLSGDYRLKPEWSVGAILTRSLRVPGIEELYSEGPHLAAYSYEVGDPDLEKETGLGGEFYTRYGGAEVSGRLAVFNNEFRNYIYPRNTGEINNRLLLPIYQSTGAPARIAGAEATLGWQMTSRFALNGSLAYVRGTLTDADEPLPWIPPLSGGLGIEYKQRQFTLGTSLRASAKQERTGEFEEPTDGWVVLDAFAQYHITTGSLLHTFDLVLENVTNTEYRDHLSRVKSVMPEPGFNLRLLYKAYF